MKVDYRLLEEYNRFCDARKKQLRQNYAEKFGGHETTFYRKLQGRGLTIPDLIFFSQELEVDMELLVPPRVRGDRRNKSLKITIK